MNPIKALRNAVEAFKAKKQAKKERKAIVNALSPAPSQQSCPQCQPKHQRPPHPFSLPKHGRISRTNDGQLCYYGPNKEVQPYSYQDLDFYLHLVQAERYAENAQHKLEADAIKRANLKKSLLTPSEIEFEAVQQLRDGSKRLSPFPKPLSPNYPTNAQ
jgi:hypothetical protein